MAAKIQFSDGIEATLLDQQGRWVCSDQQKKSYLHLRTQIQLRNHGPDCVAPIENLARTIAEIAGAKLIHADPEPDGARGDLETAWRMREAKARGIDPELLEWGKAGSP